MTPTELLAVVGDAGGAAVDDGFGTLTVDVPVEAWVTTATGLRDDPRTALDFFDWLSAYDDGDAGLAVVVRAWSVRLRHGVLLRTRVPRDGASLPSLVGVWAGAAWHERETHEMFGIDVTGHPDLSPLLLPDGFGNNPLRKEFVLASRVVKAWPGAKEPGESDADLAAPVRGRGRKRPPGVPDPGRWGAS